MSSRKDFQDRPTIRRLIDRIRGKTHDLGRTVRVMEVCGTHTMAVHRHGLRKPLLEAGVEMVSGPGCPVCITPDAYHEAAIRLVRHRENFLVTTFGDMTRVPTPSGSLQTVVPAPGSAVRILYSPLESLDLAQKNREKEILFFGVGFETTIPSIGLTLQRAAEKRLGNFSVLSALWLIPPALRAILEAGEVKVDGFLYPGHVSAIIGEAPYAFVAEEFRLPGVSAGFEPTDILLSVLFLLDQVQGGKPAVYNEYTRAVRPEGNPRARTIMEKIFEPKDAFWRGLGLIPSSGLKIREEYAPWDAERKHGLAIRPESTNLAGCRCGEILRGLLSPSRCVHFARRCTPDSPLGPCMVSVEGACFIHFTYSREP